jgi:glutamine amidotransferase
MTSVAVINYGMGNIDSLCRALEQCGGDPILTDKPAEIAGASRVILPGVGAFPKAMENLHRLGLADTIVEAGRTRPLLGICLGMQLLADSGTEIQDTPGLGLVPGRIERLAPQQNERVPHIGWNELNHTGRDPLLAGIPSGMDFYFVHSFHFVCAESADAIASTPYCGTATGVVGRGLVRGVQFHPEKSQPWGFRLLRNFLEM